MSAGLFDDDDIELLRTALRDYTADSVAEILGPIGQSALARGDLDGVARQLPGSGRLATLVRLFVLGHEVLQADARTALAPLPLDRASAAGLIAAGSDAVRALVDVRPYAQESAERSTPWWVVSDFGSDVRGGPLSREHVLGIGAASLTLAQATPRAPVDRALDIGTGCGIQALHLGMHAAQVVATDVSPRALRFAATTAELSGQSWDLRAGSLLSPVADERFDLVVANPPFVVSPGVRRYEYRDSGLAGDGVCEALVRGLRGSLTQGGTAQLLANWIIGSDGAWQERLAGWLDGTGCDAWVWQREVAEPGEYVAMWLRDAGEQPGSANWRRHYDTWLDWFAAQGVAALGMGLITLWRTDAADPVWVLEDVRQPVEQPIGAHLPDWHARQLWLADTSDAELLSAGLAAAPGLVRERREVLDPDGWRVADIRVRQSFGMRWEVEVDDAVSALIAGCDGHAPLRTPVQLLAASLARPEAEVAEAVLPVVRDLIARGFLVPAGGR